MPRTVNTITGVCVGIVRTECQPPFFNSAETSFIATDPERHQNALCFASALDRNVANSIA